MRPAQYAPLHRRGACPKLLGVHAIGSSPPFRFGISFYDALYAALAQIERAPLITADTRRLNAPAAAAAPMRLPSQII